MFVGMGLSSVVAVVHGCLTYGASQFNQQMQYEWMIYEGIQYTLGAALYAVRYETPLHYQRLNSNGPPPRLEFLNASALTPDPPLPRSYGCSDSPSWRH